MFKGKTECMVNLVTMHKYYLNFRILFTAIYMSILAYFAFFSMKSLRGATSSPISMENR